jgi:hypothetical protein
VGDRYLAGRPAYLALVKEENGSITQSRRPFDRFDVAIGEVPRAQTAGAQGAYNQWDFLEEKRAALEKWEAKLIGIVQRPS